MLTLLQRPEREFFFGECIKCMLKTHPEKELDAFAISQDAIMLCENMIGQVDNDVILPVQDRHTYKRMEATFSKETSLESSLPERIGDITGCTSLCQVRRQKHTGWRKLHLRVL